jgi:hypothetical protein
MSCLLLSFFIILILLYICYFTGNYNVHIIINI